MMHAQAKNTRACDPGDDRATIQQKIDNLRRCRDLRVLRERECWGGGDENHIIQINQRNKQIRDCEKLLPGAPVRA